MRILIAEDDSTSRAILAGALQKMGHEVVETADGLEAWEVLREPGAPRMAIIDWMMPAMDGLETVSRVRAMKTDRQPYIIMLTAKDARADLIAGLDAGVNEYLVKPFDIGELRARVNVGRRMVEAQDALAGKIEELGRALAEIKTLRGIVPICASCKKIRDDKGYWNQVEIYVSDRTEAEFSHGLCPECATKLYPDLYSKTAQP